MTARSLCFALSIFVLTPEVHSDTLLQVTGPDNWATSPAANPDQNGNYFYLYASWDQAIAYSGVNIAFTGHAVSSPATGTAYLTTSTGPGTTVADQVAVTAFSAPVGLSSSISLFSGLTLPPGLYYLMIFANPGSEIAWAATSPSTVTTMLGAGVTLNPHLVQDGVDLQALGPYAPYPPATTYVFGFQDNLLIDVASTPEPATVSLLAIGLLAMVWKRPVI